VLNKNKQPVHMSISVALLKDQNGVPVGTVRVSRDVTKEVELVERINAERDNMNQIFESRIDGVYMVSKDYKIEFVNKVLINEFGDGTCGICYDVFYNRDEPCLHQLQNRGGAEKKGSGVGVWYSRRMNKTYDIIETPMRHVDGTVSKLTFFRDVTKRKRAEEQLKLLARSLQEHVEMLEESKEQITRAYSLREHFLKETSHRIITPVTVICGYIELMLESRNLDDKQREMLMTIRERNNEVQK
jgi:PAS domain-containing protein